MQCVILAAGLGTRMGELTKTTPKPMLRVLEKPLLEHHLEFLPEEIDEAVFVIGYLGSQIQEYFGNEWKGKSIRYVVHETIDGTAGALHSAKDLLKGRFLVTMGDDLYRSEDLKALMCHQVALLGLFVQDAASFGIVTKDDEDNLMGVVERPHGFTNGLINAGAYVLTQEFFRYEPVSISETEKGLPQTLAAMAKDVAVKVVTASAWQPVGKPEDIPKAEAFLSQQEVCV